MPKPGRFLALSVDADEKLYLWALAALAFGAPVARLFGLRAPGVIGFFASSATP